MSERRVIMGIDRLLADWSLAPGDRWGLITNYTGVTGDLELSSTALWQAGAPVAALATPEHGLRGTVQAGESEEGGADPVTGLPVLDTYRLEGEALDDALAALDVDALIVDLQDIGARYYTYSWTMVDCMRSAARLGIPFYIADRPNPLGGVKVAGPGVSPRFDSFVGRIDVPMRHGLTIGELGRVAAALDRRDGISTPDPHVITMDGWDRQMLWEQTGLDWVMPSPNIPTPESAFAFVGNALFEGTNMTEGRGTTRPFELIGAPWLDDEYARRLTAMDLPGVKFRAAWFQPTFSKHAGTPVGGVQMYIEDRRTYRPLETAIWMLAVAQELSGGQFQWREPAWEEGSAGPRRYFEDLLWGSAGLREALDEGNAAAAVSQLDQAVPLRDRDQEWLLY